MSFEAIAGSRAEALRARLKQLREERGDLRERGAELAAREGQVLLEASMNPDLTLTEACALLGQTRPTGYRLMDAVRARVRRRFR